MRRVSRSATVAGSVALALAVGAVGALSAQAAGRPTQQPGHKPAGNNGTVKLDRLAFDDAPDNQPHVGCVFQVDFYGYDQGDLHATVTFDAQPPTLPAGSDRTLLTDRVFIGEDDAAGGGSRAGLDASRTYRLDLSGISPHPQQGVHVKLTVNAEGSRGADVKHKAFWVTGCGSSTPPPTPTPTGTPTVTPTVTPTPSHSPTPATPSGPTPTQPSPSTTTPSQEAPDCSVDDTDETCQVVDRQPAFTG